jgi:hypothetical protein
MLHIWTHMDTYSIKHKSFNEPCFVYCDDGYRGRVTDTVLLGMISDSFCVGGGREVARESTDAIGKCGGRAGWPEALGVQSGTANSAGPRGPGAQK